MKITNGEIPQTNMKYVTVNTSCGNRVFGAIRVNVGSRDETNEYSGLAHCLEHMFFQGTSKYPTSKDLSVELFKCDGYFNAYTSRSSTVFYILSTKKCIDKAIEILSDTFYHSLFRESDLTKEKKVIINEVNDELSDPQQNMFLGLNELAFKHTRLEKKIAGNKDTVNNLNTNILKNFINTYYKKGIIISISGNISNEKSLSLIKKYFKKNCHYSCQKIPKIMNDRKRIIYNDYLFRQTKFQVKYIHKNVKQSFIGIMFPSYKSRDKKIYVVSYICGILSGYIGSRLLKTLRDDYGLTYHVSTDYSYFKDYGSLTISLSTQNNSEKILQCIQLIFYHLKDIQFNVSNEEFHVVRNNMIEWGKNQKNNYKFLAETSMQVLCDDGKIISYDEIMRNIKQVTINDIKKVSREIFKKEYCTVCYTSKKKINIL
jgi:predicted Zn-dependent peptidase